MESSSAASRIAVVETFYTAVRSSGDVGSVIDEHFAADASVEWPASLPYGGRVDGAHRLSRMFAQMAVSDVKVGPDALDVVSITASGDHVAAELAFDWFPPGKTTAIASGALELWTFAGDEVRSIRAFYWDTAALVAAMA